MCTKIGEVVEANTISFAAQSYELHQAPPFGSLVRASDGEADIFGLVYSVVTASIDTGRRPIARGRDEQDEEDIYRNNPQLPKLLRTNFDSLIVGFRQAGTVRQYLPPRPPRLHGFVYLSGNAEIVEFTQSLDFLNTIVSCSLGAPLDELAAACVRLAEEARGGDYSFRVAAGRELAMLLSTNQQRLKAILRRIRQ
jgi:hypothetical protein